MRFAILPLLVVAAGCAAHKEPYSRASLREAMRVVTPPDRYDALLDAIYKGLLGAVDAQGKAVPPNAAEVYKELTRSAMPYEEVLEWSADAYEKNFSPEELQDLIAFYKSPVGAKIGQRSPEIIGDLMQRIRETVVPRLQRLMKKRRQAPPG